MTEQKIILPQKKYRSSHNITSCPIYLYFIVSEDTFLDDIVLL